MTEQEQNIAIAEACGWKRGHWQMFAYAGPTEAHSGHIWSESKATAPDGTIHDAIPNYVGDLNACHEAEATLTDRDDKGECRTFVECLRSKLERDNKLLPSPFGMLHATAPQRCEAFLRVKGLWKE